jgi:hypothetical protein
VKKWEERRIHGQIPLSLDDKLVDKEQYCRRLKYGDIKGKHKLQEWQLRIRHSVQTILRKIF